MVKSYRNISFMMMLLPLVFLAKAEGPSSSLELMDITSRLNANEINLIDSYEEVVYLTPDLVQALGVIEVKEDSTLKYLKDLVHSGYLVAPYNETIIAVDEAIKICADQNPNHLSLPALFSYKALLETGEALLIKENAVRGQKCSKTTFNKICVRSIIARCIKANNAVFCNATVDGILNVCNINGATCSNPVNNCPLLINSDARVCGTLNGTTANFVDLNVSNVLNVCNINGSTCPNTGVCTLNVNSPMNVCGCLSVNGTPVFGCGDTPVVCDPANPPIAFAAPITTCGNITFNTTNGLLNTVGAFETNLQVLRGVIGFSGSGITAGGITVPVIGGGNVVIGGGLPAVGIVSPMADSGLAVSSVTQLPALSLNTDVLGISQLTNSVNAGLSSLITSVNGGLGTLVTGVNGAVGTVVSTVNTALSDLVNDANDVFANVIDVVNANTAILNALPIVGDALSAITGTIAIPSIQIPDVPAIPPVVIPAIAIPSSLSLSTTLGFTFHVDFEQAVPFVEQPVVELTYSLSNPSTLISSAGLGVQSLAITAANVTTAGMDINVLLNVASGLANIGTTLTAPLATLLNNLFAPNNLQINLVVTGGVA